MAASGRDQRWTVRLDCTAWEHQKCTDMLEALYIEVVNAGLRPVAIGSATKKGWVDLELDARSEQDARDQVEGVLKRCGAECTITDTGLARG
jgi:hypothetical protein